MMAEAHIRQACKETLLSLKPIKRVRFEPAQDAEADGALSVYTNGGKLDYAYTIKKALNHSRLQHLLAQVRPTTDRPFLLLTDQLSPALSARLVRAGVQFVDTAGNVFLDSPGGLYILVQGVKPSRPMDAKPERLFQASGLQVLFVLLAQPSATDLNYRELAATSGVSLGTVAVIMKELKHKGVLERKGPNAWSLTQKRKLMDQWVGGYGGRLRPKLLQNRYRARRGDLGRALLGVKRVLGAREPSWAVTGGFAADVLTGHFRGEQLSIFAKDEVIDDLTKHLQWLPSREGDITLFRLFSPAVISEQRAGVKMPVAHPLLVYAELVFQGGERELETARILYQREINEIVHAD
jgi:hypothetical protein